MLRGGKELKTADLVSQSVSYRNRHPSEEGGASCSR